MSASILTRALCACCVLLPGLLWAQTSSPYQTTGTGALGLTAAAPVSLGGSDASSAQFQTAILPSISDLLHTKLSETSALGNVQALALDSSKLRLATDATARVYFVGEGAAYHNTLGFNALQPGETLTSGLDDSAKIIFGDASSSVSSLGDSSTPQRSARNPLLPGDFVDLGHFTAGTMLDFFLVANGAHGGTNVFTADAQRNPDHINHVVSFAVKDSPYLILAFEDLLGGGDRDYNDLIMAVDIGYENVQRLVAAPEPTMGLMLASFVGLAAWTRSRKRPAALALA